MFVRDVLMLLESVQTYVGNCFLRVCLIVERVLESQKDVLSPQNSQWGM